MRNLRIAQLLFNRPLMISEAKLAAILHVLGPRFQLDVEGLPSAELALVSDQERARAGYCVQDGTGVIGIYGPLMHRVLASDFPSGGPTTYGEIRRAFDLAIEDDAVERIVLDIDSPGGEVHGVFDLADHIYQARRSKPITAVVNESAFSAAYLLASAAGRIAIPRTGGAGSIGVIATHCDLSQAEAEAGIAVTQVYAGARKADFSPHQPLTSEALTVLQGLVDDTYELFCDTVARNRGMKVQAVRETEAGIFEGPRAVAAKLADTVSAVDIAVAGNGQRKSTITATASRAAAGKEHAMTIEELRQQHPELVGQIEAAARQGMIANADAETARSEAVTAERGRVLALVEAAVGEEPTGRIRAAADKGLTAEDLQALGVSLVPEAAAPDTRQEMLEAITAAAPQGVKTGAGKPDEAAERQAAIERMAKAGSVQ